MIPEGQRALSVRVNDVVGVAGYVLPGTRVDVVATVNPTQNQTDMTSKVILTNVQVVAAGTKIEQDDKNKPIQVAVVTLLVNPDEAEKLTLASTEGKIQLALRNPLDKTAPATNGIRPAPLMGGGAGAPRRVSIQPLASRRQQPPQRPRRPRRSKSSAATSARKKSWRRSSDDANDRAAEVGRRVRRPDVHHRRLRDAACHAGAGGAWPLGLGSGSVAAAMPASAVPGPASLKRSSDPNSVRLTVGRSTLSTSARRSRACR